MTKMQCTPAFLTGAPLRTASFAAPPAAKCRSTSRQLGDRFLHRSLPSAHLRPGFLRHAPNIGTGSVGRYTPSVRHSDLNVFIRTWAVARPPAQAGALIVPGYQWHSGWFSTIAQPLASAGVEVVSVDALSTGRSDDIRGVRGLLLDLDDHIDDLVATLSAMRRRLGIRAPIFVLGESSGGLTACTLALRHPQLAADISGWILCAPAITIAPELLPPKPVLAILRMLAGQFPTLPTPQAVSGETFDAAFGDGVSAEIARHDPYVLYKTPIPVAAGTATLDAIDEVLRALDEGELAMRRVLVLHNKKDARTLFCGSQKLVENVVGEATLVDPGGGAHQLFQERSEVTNEVVARIVSFVETT